jgi:hypothetical protein
MLDFGIVLGLQVDACSDLLKHCETPRGAHDPAIGPEKVYEDWKVNIAGIKHFKHLLYLLKLANSGYGFLEARN